jgi:hypothetical protein
MFDKSGPFREKLKARGPTQKGVSPSLAGREVAWLVVITLPYGPF